MAALARVSNFAIAAADLAASDVQVLLTRHLVFARSHSPPEDAHALDADGLAAEDVSFYALRDGDSLLGIGALKHIGAGHAEIKSMHTAEAARGRGVGRAMLRHLLAEARARGCIRVSLETGSMPAFAPARALYESAGFQACEPFDNYRTSPNSTYLTLRLEPES